MGWTIFGGLAFLAGICLFFFGGGILLIHLIEDIFGEQNKWIRRAIFPFGFPLMAVIVVFLLIAITLGLIYKGLKEVWKSLT